MRVETLGKEMIKIEEDHKENPNEKSIIDISEKF
jgi:hypothetical protein